MLKDTAIEEIGATLGNNAPQRLKDVGLKFKTIVRTVE
jgi:hypothetical protein